MNAPNIFFDQIHHGGRFHKYPGKRYVDGHVGIFDMVDIDLFTVIALNRMVMQLGYTGEFQPLSYNYLRPMSTLNEGLYALAYDEDIHCLATLVGSFKLVEVYREHGFTVVNSYQRPPPQESIYDTVTPRSMPQNDSSTPAKDFVCESVTRMDVTFVTHRVTSLVLDDVLKGEDLDVVNPDGFNSDTGNDNEISTYKRRRLDDFRIEMEGFMNASGRWKYSFYTSQKFYSSKEAKDRVYLYSNESRRMLKLCKNGKIRVRARCEGNVPIFTMS
ncbi:hypothetical protein Tco_0946181 [Tanacetum coccineum]